MRRCSMIPAWLRSQDGFGLVEALIALTILVIGLTAVTGLTLASATQARIADWRGDQALAGQFALETMQRDGFAAATTRADTINVDGHDYVVALTVTTVSPRVKEVRADVAGVGHLGTRSYTTRLYRPRPLPDPVSPFGGGGGGGGEETPTDSTGIGDTPIDTVTVTPGPIDSIGGSLPTY